ncbi:MAG: RICIN domain-containing protein [Nitrospirae bacterium]|nr:RICIN domain-containing protein [Nitrospirota bacterium]
MERAIWKASIGYLFTNSIKYVFLLILLLGAVETASADIAFSIVNKQSGKCVDGVTGLPLQATCTGADSQSFNLSPGTGSYTGYYTIVNVASGNAFSVGDDNNVGPGSKIYMGGNYYTEVFAISTVDVNIYAIQSKRAGVGNSCLSFPDSIDGTNLQLDTCNSSNSRQLFFWGYVLTVSKTGKGTVTSSNSQISCGSTCVSVYSTGTSVTLTATPDTGYTFSGYTGCDSQNGSQCTVQISAKTAVKATFLPLYTLNVSTTGSGTVVSTPSGISCGSSCSTQYASGTSVVLTATPSSGYGLSSWTGCDSTNGTQCTVSMASARNVTATFLPYYTVSVTKTGTGTGTITSKPAGVSCGSTCSSSFISGTGLYLTATAASGSTFSGYTGCDTVNGSGCYVLVSSAKNVTATFTLSVSADYSAASTMVNTIYSQYPSVFGTKSGAVITGADASGTYYIQWFTNGSAIMAYSDGHMYYYYGGNWYSLGVVWNYYAAASAMINTVYSEYYSFFGTKSGSIVTGTSGSATYYTQWFTNGAALVAWTDGTIYTYYNGTWYPLGVKWSSEPEHEPEQ